MRQNKERAMAQYVRKAQRTPGNFEANSYASEICRQGRDK